jgi:hypothetical protein
VLAADFLRFINAAENELIPRLSFVPFQVIQNMSKDQQVYARGLCPTALLALRRKDQALVPQRKVLLHA